MDAVATVDTRPPDEQPPDWFKEYLSRGFHLLHYAPLKKGPEGTSALDWTSPDHRVTTVDQYVPNRNWGVFLGVEIQHGQYLIDIDFDWEPSLVIANRLLPDTKFIFGRQTRKYTHAFYTVSHPTPRQSFEDLDKSTFIEIRGNTEDGGVGWQTMIPPSVHPNGEQLEMRLNGSIAHDDTVIRRVQLTAVGCILFKYLDTLGAKHDQRLAIAGFLLQEGLTESEVTDTLEAVVAATQNDIKDVKFAVRSTANRLKKGETVKGAGSLAKSIGEKGTDVVRAIRRYLGIQQFRESERGKILADDQSNIKLALDRLHVSFSYDAFSNKMWCVNGKASPTMVDEPLIVPLRLRIDEHFHFRPTKDFFIDMVRDLAWKSSYHPVKDYLNTLSWDGIPRIDKWLIQYAGAHHQSDFLRAVSAIVLIAAVKRVRQPGCKFDEMLILESARQGTAKSSALAALCPRDEWFSDDLPLGVDAKQIIERTQGKWIIEASELHGYRQREADHIKSFLSRRVDGPVRLAYDRTPTETPRQFIIVGTTNTLTGYLKDFSGARRFWPVRIEAFDLDALARDRDQLWAEASHRESAGESIRLDKSLWEDAEEVQEDRRAVHPWEELITTNESIDLQSDCVIVNKVWQVIGVQANQRSNTHANIISEIMQRHGFVKKERRYIDNEESGRPEQTWCWVRQTYVSADVSAGEDDLTRAERMKERARRMVDDGFIPE